MNTLIDTPKHACLYDYDERFLDPALVRGRREEIFTEMAEQIYAFRLFTPEFCRLLIEEAEHSGQWRTEADVEANPYSDIEEYCLPDTTQHLDKMPGLSAVYEQIIVRHLKPLMERMWVTFKLQKISPPIISVEEARDNNRESIARQFACDVGRGQQPKEPL